MIQGITKQEFIETLDERLDIKLGQKLNQKLDEKFALFEISFMKKIEKVIDDKFDAFAVLVRNSFQSIEDRVVTKDDLKKFETRFELKVNRKLSWFL